MTGNGTNKDLVAAYAWLAQDELKNMKLLKDVTEAMTIEQQQQAKQKAEELRKLLLQKNN